MKQHTEVINNEKVVVRVYDYVEPKIKQTTKQKGGLNKLYKQFSQTK